MDIKINTLSTKIPFFQENENSWISSQNTPFFVNFRTMMHMVISLCEGFGLHTHEVVDIAHHRVQNIYIIQYKPMQYTVQTYALYSTNLCIIQYKPTHYTVQTYALYSTNLCIIQYKPMHYTVQTYALYSTNLCIIQ